MSGNESMARRKPTLEAALHGSIRDDRVAVLTPPRVRRAPTLEVGAVHDAAEHEADRLAGQVVARLRAQEADGGDAGGVHAHAHSAPSDVRRLAAPTIGSEGGPVSAELTDQIEGMRGRGDALDETTRRRMGEGFGADLSSVRVHTDERAASAASAMGALAFTTGNDIFFGAGQYRPDDAAGQQVLAHELAHTVQQRGGARRKVSRLWSLKTFEGADLARATSIKVLKDREVMFLKDSSDDTMVVKVEDEMIGLGALAGVMHKKLTGTETVQYLKYPAGAKATLKALLDRPELLDRESWAARGGFGETPKTYSALDDPVARGVSQFKDHLDSRRGASLMAMTFTRGERAAEANGRDAGDGGSLKALLEQHGHARDLGKMTAVDLLLGNKDRVISGNLGNWFYDPNGAMVAIDNVDALKANNMIRDIKAGTTETEYLARLGRDRLKATAKEAITGLLAGMDAQAWGNEVVDGKRRRVKLELEMKEGLEEGKRHIVKVFSSSWRKGSTRDHAAKKAIKKYARTAFAVDEGEGSQPYYETLKARAAWLKTN